MPAQQCGNRPVKDIRGPPIMSNPTISPWQQSAADLKPRTQAFIDGAPRAAAADGRWSGLAPDARKKRLLRLAELIEVRGRELALYDSLDMGKPVAEAYVVDVPGAAACFAWHAEAIDKLY